MGICTSSFETFYTFFWSLKTCFDYCYHIPNSYQVQPSPLHTLYVLFFLFLFLLFGCLLAWLIWGLKNLVWFGCLLFLLFMWLLCLFFSMGDSSVHICVYEMQADYWSQYREAKANCMLQRIATSGPMSGFWFPICSLLGLSCLLLFRWHRNEGRKVGPWEGKGLPHFGVCLEPLLIS